ncbi:MAG: sigma-70 family RNA polymerase sigma factor [Lentisphaeria bacterium]|nr:sigma-70 family RNA polymerase sigma factor [Lentisphaeria bacterium]
MVENEQLDADLIERFLKADDQQAFTVLYERHKLPIYRFLIKMQGTDQRNVDDIFQKSWMKIIDKLDQYDQSKSFLSWAFSITRNTAIDLFRKEKRYVLENEFEERIGHEDQPWRNLAGNELKEAVNAALEELIPEQKEVFLLRQEEVSFKEIAEIQACSINTALGRMRQAVAHLKKSLTDWTIT